jgi:hypothetical protein
MLSHFSLKTRRKKDYLFGIGIGKKIILKWDPKCGVPVWVEQSRNSQ